MGAIAVFEVGLKAFLVRQGRLLVLREECAPRGWELPGGRFDAGEEAVAPLDILTRELREELGESLAWELVGLRDAWVRPAPERGAHVFLLGYECRWRAGEVQLSAEHVEAAWAGPDEWQALELLEPYAEVLERFWRRGPA